VTITCRRHHHHLTAPVLSWAVFGLICAVLDFILPDLEEGCAKLQTRRLATSPDRQATMGASSKTTRRTKSWNITSLDIYYNTTPILPPSICCNAVTVCILLSLLLLSLCYLPTTLARYQNPCQSYGMQKPSMSRPYLQSTMLSTVLPTTYYLAHYCKVTTYYLLPTTYYLLLSLLL
jgi:hypothetical protein